MALCTVGQTQLCRYCLWLVFNTATCFGCPHLPASGRAQVHRTSKRAEAKMVPADVDSRNM